MDFLQLLKVDVSDFVEMRPLKKNDNSDEAAFIAWARAVQLAGRPPFETVTFHDGVKERGCRSFFGGSVVAVDMEIDTGEKQRIYLPVLGHNNSPVPAGKETAATVGAKTSRCIGKAIAMVHGLGLSVFDSRTSKGTPTHHQQWGHGPSYAASLGVTPDTDLAQVAPMITMKGKYPFVGWQAAVAACRITDPTFLWEVIEVDSVDHAGGEELSLPAVKVAEGYMVGVKIRYKGKETKLWLAITDDKNNTIARPTVADWNATVMRCLAKVVAIGTGYGLSVYSEMDVGEGDPARIEACANLIEQIEQAIQDTNADRNALLKFFKVETLDAASYDRLLAILKGLESKKQALERQKQAAPPAANDSEPPAQPAEQEKAA